MNFSPKTDADPTGLDARLTRYRALLNEGLDRLLDGRPPFRVLYGMMGYHLGQRDQNFTPCAGDSGKSLRPSLCFLACESVGGETVAAAPGALAVELLHNFSLVHDDIQDGSAFRRHRPAVWTVWGIPHAINVGDGLFALAHVALAGGTMPERVRMDVERIFSQTCLEICEGQFLDLGFQQSAQVSLDDYILMARKKTAALFGCAAAIGALLGGAGAETVRLLGDFGILLGEAFQACDDVLGVWGDELATGKPARDVHERKRGLPAVLAFDRATGKDLVRLRTLYSGDRTLSNDAAAWVTRLYERLGVRGEAIAMTDALFDAADSMLTGAGLAAGTPLRQLIGLVPRPVLPPEQQRRPVAFPPRRPGNDAVQAPR